ncbi:MAG: dihydroorotate dehydrogenase-like protein [Dysgonamonadaceae bacterium]|jgi:dihydroorotate dehydrogenase (fumarate)|nr:dihydroorotate dehydrogenase-like protein [Dysgonamonadaceae bacterium]
MGNTFETRFAGLNLKSPIIIGSAGLTNSAEKNKELERSGAGAVVLKSLFEEQIAMQSEWMLENSDYPEADDYIRNYVKSNEISDYIKLIQQSKLQCSIPVVASINCYKPGSWVDFARQIEMAGADAIELNVFALNTEINTGSDFLENTYIRILDKVREKVNIPVIIKMSKMFSNIVEMVNRLYAHGASGVVLFNRFYQPDIDINKLQVVSGQVFSSHTDIAETLRWTGIVSGRIPQIPIASSTGIQDWEDVVKCILAGASAIEICSAVYQHGHEIISQMKRSMEEWMHSMNYKSIDDFRGKLNYISISDPSLYERVQFMKYFSNRD